MRPLERQRKPSTVRELSVVTSGEGQRYDQGCRQCNISPVVSGENKY